MYQAIDLIIPFCVRGLNKIFAESVKYNLLVKFFTSFLIFLSLKIQIIKNFVL